MSSIVGSYGSCSLFLMNLHTYLYSGWTKLHSRQQCIRVPQSILLKTAILVEVRWNLNVVFICISFIAENVDHFFMYLIAICTSFENCLYNSFTHLLTGLFAFLLIFGALYIFWILILYLMNSWQRFSLIL
jgi:hypothetical protein